MLDTNVISELRKAKTSKIDTNLSAWAANISPSSLFLSVITILELEVGVLLVERQDRKQGAVLRTWLDSHVVPAFSGRILPIDVAVAQRCAKLHVPNPQADRDALIASTASVHGMTVVTRNIADFESMGVEIHNPWNPICNLRNER